MPTLSQGPIDAALAAKPVPAVDMAILAGIMGDSAPRLLNQVLADFLATAGTSFADVETTVAGSDPVAIKAAAHGAKGEARCAAAIPLAALYAELEQRARDVDPTVLRDLVVRLGAEVHRVEAFIHLRLAG